MRALLLCLCLALPLAGCGADDRPQPVPAAEKPQAVDQQPAPDRRVAAAAVSVVIFPERLPSDQAAKALVSGCAGPLRYAWEVNGSVIAEVSADQLPPSYFRRSDEVTVRVECQGTTATASARVDNSPPQIVRLAFGNPAVVAGQPIRIVPEAVDRDDDPADFEYRWLVDGEEVPVTGAELPGSYVKTGRQINVQVTATDGTGKSAPYQGDPFIVPGTAPRFTSQPPQSFQVEDYRYQVRAVDPDGDRITYRLAAGPPGMAIDATSGLVTWKIAPGTTGNVRVKILAEDAGGLMASQEFALTLKAAE